MAYVYDAERHQSARLHGINERIQAARKELNRITQQIFEVEDRASRAQAREATAHHARAQIEIRIKERADELEQMMATLDTARYELKATRAKKYRAARDLKELNARLSVAGAALKSVQAETRQARVESEEAQQHALRVRTALAMHFRNANDSEGTITAAERVYVAAMKAHPEDALEGRRRLRAINQEVAAASKRRHEQEKAA